MWQNAGAVVEKWSFVTMTDILAQFVEVVKKVCVCHVVLKETGKENVKEIFF